jgi:hypothetical protein
MYEGWTNLVRLLLPSERLAGEEISGAKIVEIARAGNMLSAGAADSRGKSSR